MRYERKLTMAAILPHTKLFGGVKRFLELGSVFESHGHRFLVFTPEALPVFSEGYFLIHGKSSFICNGLRGRRLPI